jgi:hypothetical protein
MKTPMFTAEASLYRTTRHYRLTAASAPFGRGAIPQMMRNEVDEAEFWDWFDNNLPVWAGSGGGGGGGGRGSADRRTRCKARCQRSYLACSILGCGLEDDGKERCLGYCEGVRAECERRCG